MKKRNLNIVIGILIILFLVTTLIIGVNKFTSKSKADEGIPLIINFSEGNIPRNDSTSNEKSNILFDAFSVKIYSTLNNRWLLPNYSFFELLSNNNTKINLSNSNIVDNETFYFDDVISDSSWAYSFTGWHIVGTDSYIPMNTVFQQGNYLDLDNIDNELFEEKDGIRSLNLEATWGKVYFIENKYENMVYSEDGDTGYYYLDEEKSTNLTGASDENIGNSLNSKLATIDEVYERLRNDDTLDETDPYHTVIMLAGDVDYYKNNGSSKESGIFGFSGKYGTSTSIGSNKIRSASFKSYQENDGDKYTLNIKPKGYYNYWYGSYRFDNINYKLMKSGLFGTQNVSSEFQLFSRKVSEENHFCFETTNRFDGTINTFRVSQTRTVVLSGGIYNTFSLGWSDEDKYGWERNWYVTDNAKIDSDLTAGYQNAATNIVGKTYGTINISIYGGTIKSIEGGNKGAYTINVGNRNIKIKGDNSGNSQYDPVITNVYGGSSQSRLFGNISLVIENCTKITNVYGGGKDFTSNVYGNVSLKINKSTILGNVYGGGYNGNTLKIPDKYKDYTYSNSTLSFVEKDVSNLNSNNFSVVKEEGGDVNLDFSNSTVKGNIYGSGFGSSQVTSFSYLSNNSYGPANNWITGVGEGTVYPTGWENSYKEYPKYDPETGYILIAAYKEINFTNLQPWDITFNVFSASAYLSLATVENVHIKLDNSVVGTSNRLNDKTSGNVYGGGSISKVLGNTEIEIINNSIIYGNVYGGGDGSTKPDPVTVYKPIDDDVYEMSKYEILSVFNNNGSLSANVKVSSQKPSYNSSIYGKFNWSGDVSLLNSKTKGIDFENKLLYSENTKGLGSVIGDTSVVISNNSLINGSVYGGGNAGIVEGNTGVYIYSSDVNGMVYAGGDSADILKDTKLVIDDNSSIKKNVFGGGNSGNILGNSNINISNSSLTSIFGGGYSGVVSGNITIKVNSGKLENVFGGGDQSYVNGDTNVTIGNEDSSGTVMISGLVYGGGRGYDADGDGDASDFTTVKGSSNVLIQGINTNVENYGSTKLGAVAGNVEVNFKNYWSGNSTAKYKTMNGIDRATTVSFDNSYVLLENKGTDGKLVGIKSIENLIIPQGSGLKISANGEITGNFNGGGELYLDSLVSLTVQGNITGQTTLILNPKLLENGNKTIKGGLDFPYLKVGGNSPEEIAVVSGESNKYVIREADKDTVNDLKGENYIYFYISGDVSVDNSIDIISSNEYGRNYINSISNDKNIYMLNNEIFTSDVDVDYYLTNDDYNTYDYTNINRKLELISNSSNSSINIPKGTEIVMKINEKYYFYQVDKDDVSQINLTEFKNELGANYVEISNFDTSDSVTKTINEINGTTSYSLDEKYKFIFNFNNTTGINKDSYYPSLEIFYGENSFSKVKKDTASNVVNIQKREYNLSLKKDKTSYEGNGIIKLDGKLNISSLNTNTKINFKNLNLRLRLKNSENNYVDIPEGTILTIDDKKYLVKNGIIKFDVLNNIDTSEINSDVNLILDMNNVLPQDQLISGDYTFTFEYLYGKNYHELSNVNINLVDIKMNFGLKLSSNVINDNFYDKLKIIKFGTKESRSIKINFSNDSVLNNMNIKIKAIERTSSFVYEETKNASNNIVINNDTVTTSNKKELVNNIDITFKENLSKGTYRIIAELYDDAGNFKTSDYVNFIVD